MAALVNELRDALIEAGVSADKANAAAAAVLVARPKPELWEWLVALSWAWIGGGAAVGLWLVLMLSGPSPDSRRAETPNDRLDKLEDTLGRIESKLDAKP